MNFENNQNLNEVDAKELIKQWEKDTYIDQRKKKYEKDKKKYKKAKKKLKKLYGCAKKNQRKKCRKLKRQLEQQQENKTEMAHQYDLKLLQMQNQINALSMYILLQSPEGQKQLRSKLTGQSFIGLPMKEGKEHGEV